MAAADLSIIPLAGLSAESRQLISNLLNPPKVIPASTGLLRDWRGLAQLCSLGGEILPAIATDPDPTNRILTIVQKRPEQFSLLSLKDALEKIERWDILDDSQALLEKDAQSYLERLQRSQAGAKENNFSAEAEILTLDDQFRIERGEQKQHYDAFLLYADEDADFAFEMVEQLEKKNNLKLCLKDRDLIAGISFEHEAIMKLISERCNRLITILSPEFLESPANKFFVNFAQANSIDKRQERKIIPCVYKNCELPPQLTYFSKIYYKKLSQDFFWNKLLCSMKVVPSTTESSKKAIENVPTKSENEVEKTNLQNGFDKVPIDGHRQTTSGETSRPIRLTGSRSFPFVKQKKSVPTAPSTSAEGSVKEESIPELPHLDGLDSLSSITEDSSPKKKSKKKKKFMEKMQALLAK